MAWKRSGVRFPSAPLARHRGWRYSNLWLVAPNRRTSLTRRLVAGVPERAGVPSGTSVRLRVQMSGSPGSALWRSAGDTERVGQARGWQFGEPLANGGAVEAQVGEVHRQRGAHLPAELRLEAADRAR